MNILNITERVLITTAYTAGTALVCMFWWGIKRWEELFIFAFSVILSSVLHAIGIMIWGLLNEYK